MHAILKSVALAVALMLAANTSYAQSCDSQCGSKSQIQRDCLFKAQADPTVSAPSCIIAGESDAASCVAACQANGGVPKSKQMKCANGDRTSPGCRSGQ